MSRMKRKLTPFHTYETNNKYDEKYIRVTRTLLMNKKFIELSSNAKVLYLYMRDWGYPTPEVKYSISMARELMSKNTFIKCINELIQAGFIKLAWSNKYSGQPNIYVFSDNWWKN